VLRDILDNHRAAGACKEVWFRSMYFISDGMHMIFECPALHALRQQYAPLFSTNTDTMRCFFAQQDHMQVFKFVLSCLDILQI